MDMWFIMDFPGNLEVQNSVISMKSEVVSRRTQSIKVMEKVQGHIESENNIILHSSWSGIILGANNFTCTFTAEYILMV